MMDASAKAIAIEHIKNHHDGFPTTKADLVAACNNMSEFSEKDKEWFTDTLSEATYESAEEVIKGLGW